MLAAERRKKIIDLVHQDKRVLVSDLSRMFEVTEETIRRDLEKLEKDGILSRTYGGAMLNRHTNEDLPFVTRNALNTDMKRNIALKALDLINDGDTLMVDPSSTAFEFLKLLGNKNNLTVITNSINILHEFASSGMNIISSGGSLRHRSLSLVGPVAHDTIRRYNVDTAVISCKGIDMERGVTDSNEPECELKKYMLRQAQKVVLLADHTKFDKTAFTRLVELSSIDVLITDRRPAESWLTRLAEENIEVLY
ncbi:DeoR/GlpR transcriptional regulator [Paenibacillus sonchi]|uniref:DeoR/GlpR transcriptional regulator n=4 Tax=Paenibacillus sonchi group TaxID=2044880 RepID=A0A974PB76_9BACL|nr:MULTISPECIES: DeoR/GlpR family DNA-binding transcription regulator [Paenibacillus sonchi group]MCE3201406.1 DeoR/GlpR family DNA-binding transcription regulator [Paenibacillus sonchi]QQZ60097.1 DeoR/GlpR transcriptional regulator [Paenibacillus sonchi]CQR56329.1 putative HTH-type transcriptional regulator YdjF [Paenibacillus riograndensis SBR5]